MAASAPDAGKRLPNSVLAMIIFVVTEIMFFAALMSAHTIARATVMGGVWPPAGQPRLPVERTAKRWIVSSDPEEQVAATGAKPGTPKLCK